MDLSANCWTALRGINRTSIAIMRIHGNCCSWPDLFACCTSWVYCWMANWWRMSLNHCRAINAFHSLTVCSGRRRHFSANTQRRSWRRRISRQIATGNTRHRWRSSIRVICAHAANWAHRSHCGLLPCSEYSLLGYRDSWRTSPSWVCRVRSMRRKWAASLMPSWGDIWHWPRPWASQRCSQCANCYSICTCCSRHSLAISCSARASSAQCCNGRSRRCSTCSSWPRRALWSSS